MKVMYSYLSSKGEMWSTPFCKIINAERYSKLYGYLVMSINDVYYMEAVDRHLYEISRVEKGEIECFGTGVDIFSIDVYRDRVEFIYNWEDEEWPDWSCTLEEYKRVLLGQKAFLMLPKEPESYLEIKINDIE